MDIVVIAQSSCGQSAAEDLKRGERDAEMITKIIKGRDKIALSSHCLLPSDIDDMRSKKGFLLIKTLKHVFKCSYCKRLVNSEIENIFE